MSYVIQLFASQCHRIFLVKGKENGRWPCYFYILVDKDKVERFVALGDDALRDLQKYGKIIESGYGEEPSEEIKTLMKTRYAFE